MPADDPSIWQEFSGLNAAYLLDLYERFRESPEAVDPQTRAFFDQWGPPPAVAGPQLQPPAPRLRIEPLELPDLLHPRAAEAQLVAGAVALATAIREHGHRQARLDPLGTEPSGDAALRPDTHGIREEDLARLPASVVGGPAAANAGNALAAVRELRRIYQGTSGYEFEHVSDAREREWLRAAVEGEQFRPPRDPIDERQLLARLTEVGAFERFLHTAFPGQTRFSLEGLGMLVPVLDEIVGAAAEAGTRSVMLGMAHRGRLNVLAHTLGKPYDQLIAEFLGDIHRARPDESDGGDEGWTGDVRYHLGARRAYRDGREVDMLVYLAPNPSHLEWVDPVVEGLTRACGERRDRRGPATQDEVTSMALLIHGDASFPGQGIVAETLNLSRLLGYRTGGTIHLITNNQVGFTTPPAHGRSTRYASDLAKGFEIPIIHVNADDPEACIAASRLAHAYRERFRKDVLIDLIGYRRWGHNEGDEPSFTQPRLYALIREHPTVRELWAQELEERGLIEREEAQSMLQSAIERLHGLRRSLVERQRDEASPDFTAGLEAGGQAGGLGTPGVAAELETAVPADRLASLNEELYRLPPGFHLHPKLERPFARRRAALSPGPVDEAGGRQPEEIEWAHAEALAFASILADGTPIRLTGQDSVRGTFSQRHAVLHDPETGASHVPLQSLPMARASFDVWNSPLSEPATLGFEFGYSAQAPEVLVLWEAQYGDFTNVAQATIDQFIATARSKWEQRSALVLLLPHGYEGQGPEHSSARLERFLQMAAEDNLRVADCSTAAQYFHILRRQAQLLRLDPRPLVLLTPKSLLRNPNAASPPEALSRGRFLPVIDDPEACQGRDAVRRLILCRGKLYYDLAAARSARLPEPESARQEDNGPPAEAEHPRSRGRRSTNGPRPSAPPHGAAIVRVEELYPFPVAELGRLVESYPRLEEVIWAQEEPRNMGAWTYMAPRLRDLLGRRLPLVYVGRTRRASPAEGSHEWHDREQARLVEAALRFEPAAPVPELALGRERQ